MAAILFRSRLRSLRSSSVVAEVAVVEGPGGRLAVDPSDSRLILGCLAGGGPPAAVAAASVGADFVLARTPPPAVLLVGVALLVVDEVSLCEQMKSVKWQHTTSRLT